jgi:hypothetical protein
MFFSLRTYGYGYITPGGGFLAIGAAERFSRIRFPAKSTKNHEKKGKKEIKELILFIPNFSHILSFSLSCPFVGALFPRNFPP